MDMYKAKIESDGSLDKLNLRTLKYFLADATKHKAIFRQLDFIGSFLQAKVKNRLFVRLDSRYIDYFLNIQSTLEEP